MRAVGKKERNTPRHVRVDLCVQRPEVHLEQRPVQHGHGDEIEEEKTNEKREWEQVNGNATLVEQERGCAASVGIEFRLWA